MARKFGMKHGYWAVGLILGGFAVLNSGCGSTLDDGYKPRPLNASSARRRAYYATPFTPEATAAGQEKEDQFKARRPGGY